MSDALQKAELSSKEKEQVLEKELEKDNDLEELIQDSKALTQQNSELLQIIDSMNDSEKL